MRSRTSTVCLLVLLIASSARAAQSLAGLAQQEADRRKAIRSPVRVITDQDLRPVAGPVPTQQPPASSTPRTAAGEDGNLTRTAPARYLTGSLPAIPIQAVGGGEVLLELTVDRNGHVAALKVLRHTPPFTDAVLASLGSWQFRPAEEEVEAPRRAGEAIGQKTRRPAESRVLVAAMFRPPALYAATLGVQPADIATASDEAPFPVGSMAMPLYPPLAQFDGVVLAELRVGADGHLASAAILRSAPPFDQPALESAYQWSLRPARVRGRPAETLAYAIFAFRAPITVSPSSTGSPITAAPASTPGSANQNGNPNRP